MFPRLTREPRLSDKVAEALLRTITTRRLKAGQRLPSERELGEQFGVSRTVIREAVRSLAARGVIEVRTGSGLRVAHAGAAVSESMKLYLRGSGALDYSKVNEVRMMLETEIAEVAAFRANEHDVKLLSAVCEGMGEALGDVEAASLADVEFHRALAKATQNELYLALLDSIGDVLLEIRYATLGVPGRPEKGLKAHRKIRDRVAVHDPAGARDAMRAHLLDSMRAWRHLPQATQAP